MANVSTCMSFETRSLGPPARHHANLCQPREWAWLYISTRFCLSCVNTLYRDIRYGGNRASGEARFTFSSKFRWWVQTGSFWPITAKGNIVLPGTAPAWHWC